MRLLYLITLVVILFYSCRKNDVSKEPEIEKINKFFDLPADSDNRLKAIAACIKSQNDKFNFLEELVERVGLPVWGNTKTFNSGGSASRSSGNEGEIVYIPFAKENDNYINSVLAVKISNDTSFRMIHKFNYRSFGFDTTSSDSWSARDIFNLFVLFDNYVFDHKSFLLKDGRILNVKDSVIVQLKNVNTLSTGRVAGFYRICFTYVIECSSNTGPAYARTESLEGGCTQTSCSSYWYDDSDGGSTGNPGSIDDGSGGGSGGDGSWYEDPCKSTDPIRRTMNTNCPESTGWEPESNDQWVEDYSGFGLDEYDEDNPYNGPKEKNTKKNNS
jgi:hypothetical protein